MIACHPTFINVNTLDLKKLHVSKNTIEGKFIDLISVSDKDVADPAFEKYVDGKSVIQN